MKWGYARVLTKGQNLERQITALNAEGCDKIVTEKASAKFQNKRPELEKIIDALKPDDVLVLAEWDRCTRSLWDGMQIIFQIVERKALVKVLDREYIDLTTATGRGLLAFFSGIAEDELKRIHKRAEDGRKAAFKKGVKFGRKPKLSDHQQDLARKRKSNGDSVRAIAKDLGVHYSTISRL